MPLQNQVLTALQAAGAAVHAADLELKSAIRSRADGLKQTLNADPFDISGDMLFEDWKSLAQLSAAVSKVESEMLMIYDAATRVQALNGGVSSAVRSAKRARNVALERLRSLERLEVSKELAKREENTNGTFPQPIRGNAAKVYALVKDQLNVEGFVPFNKAGFAKEHGISIGSIGAAIDILVRKGYLEKDAYRQLKLRSHSAPPSADGTARH